MPPSLFTVGDLVEVDQMKTGYIIEIDSISIPQNNLFKIRYSDGDVEDEVEKYRCRPKSLRRTAALRSGRVRSALPIPQSNDPPQIVIETHNPVVQPLPQALLPPLPPQPQAIYPITFDQVMNAMKKAHSWSYKSEVDNELHSILKRGKKELAKGWMRRLLPLEMQPADNEDRKQLSPQAKHLFLYMSTLMAGFDSNGGVIGGWKGSINHAWDVCKLSQARYFNQMIDNRGSMERKERSDKGNNIFEDDEVRKRTFTALNTFKKFESRKFRTFHDKLDEKLLHEEFDALSENEKMNYQILADADLERARHLKEELIDVLQKTNGMVSYETLAAQLGDIVSKDCIRRYCKSQEGFKMRKDRLLPHLCAQAKKKRVQWAQSFCLFWKSVSIIKTENCIMALVQMDEKWMYVVRCRTTNKVIPLWNVRGKDRHVHHKSHVGKEMYIVVTAFVLNGNDITKGGVAVPIACIRVGRMVKAQKKFIQQGISA